MMKDSVACIETLYTEIPFIERFAAAKRDGFEYIEFWGWKDKDLEEIKKTAAEVGIGIAGFSGDANYSLIDPGEKKPYLEFLKESLEAAKKLDAKYVVIHSNALSSVGEVLNAYEDLSDTVKTCAMFDALKGCAALAEEAGVMTVLEPLNIYVDHIGNYLASTQMAAEMVEIIGSSYLKVLYDIYHMQINEGNICDTIKKYAELFGHIHIADVPGRNEPGTGELNYKQILHVLNSSKYDGLVGYELFPKTDTESAVKAIADLYRA